MELLLVFMVAVSLSMDAFSLSLAYGTLGIPRKQICLLSIIVGLFHFFMPLLGLFVGNSILNFIKINPDFIVFIVLVAIGIQMILESFSKKEEMELMHIAGLFLFAFAVSVDSFSVGITLTSIGENYILSAIIFAFSSMIFTFIGLLLGNKIKKSIGKISTIFGGTILMIIGLLFLI